MNASWICTPVRSRTSSSCRASAADTAIGFSQARASPPRRPASSRARAGDSAADCRRRRRRDRAGDRRTSRRPWRCPACRPRSWLSRRCARRSRSRSRTPPSASPESLCASRSPRRRARPISVGSYIRFSPVAVSYPRSSLESLLTSPRLNTPQPSARPSSRQVSSWLSPTSCDVDPRF